MERNIFDIKHILRYKRVQLKIIKPNRLIVNYLNINY